MTSGFVGDRISLAKLGQVTAKHHHEVGHKAACDVARREVQLASPGFVLEDDARPVNHHGRRAWMCRHPGQPIRGRKVEDALRCDGYGENRKCAGFVEARPNTTALRELGHQRLERFRRLRDGWIGAGLPISNAAREDQGRYQRDERPPSTQASMPQTNAP